MSSNLAHHDLIAAHHTFLWNKSNSSDTYEDRILQKYDESLFKEYCISDLSNFEKNKIALRWRTKKEVISGKGESICGEKECDEKENLKSWEVNFKYVEHGVQNNALVKIRLCEACAWKLAYYKKHNAEYKRHDAGHKMHEAKAVVKTELDEDITEEQNTSDNRNSVLKNIDIFQGDDFSTAECIDLYLKDLL